MKKTLHDLITSTSWSEVEKEIVDFYPDEDTEYFKQLFWKLYNFTPKNNENNIELRLDMFDEESEDIGDEEDFYYEVEYINEIDNELWEIYLGFHVSEETLENLSTEEIICHMFFELTYGDIENFIQ